MVDLGVMAIKWYSIELTLLEQSLPLGAVPSRTQAQPFLKSLIHSSGYNQRILSLYLQAFPEDDSCSLNL